MRWSIHVSDDTDKTLRYHLAERKKGGLSSFVEEAVTEKIFRQTVRNVQERNLRFNAEDIDHDINEAISAVRATPRP
jgi:predicted transcriptional regulator